MKKASISLLYIIVVCSIQAASFEAKLLDFHYRIFPDIFPDAASSPGLISVPRNYDLGFQIALQSDKTLNLSVTLSELKDANGQSSIFTMVVCPLKAVTVEGNTQGSMINVPGGDYPKEWIPYFIRNAPFDVLEVVDDPVVNSVFQMPANQTSGLLVQIKIPANCPVGIYSGNIVIEYTSSDKVLLPISFQVHKAVVERNNFLNCVHWLSADPIDLKSDGNSVAWWSEEHWILLERVGRILWEDGNNMMYTPLVNTANPLIQAEWENSTLSFDYSKFDRWISLFSSIGFKYFAGHHLRSMGSNLFVLDKATDSKKTLSQIGMNIGCFQELFLADLCAHVDELAIQNRFVMHLFDEPALAALMEYMHYNDILLRSTNGGILSIDATNSNPQYYSDYVGFQVYNLPGIVLNKNGTVKNRIEESRPVWLYNTTSPFPPYPNRHLDRPLTENRLWPLLTFKYNCSGYLFWAVNTYRGITSEYETSLGPLPNGLQRHCPGDAWFYYRTPNGLNQSLRLMSFREGMIDAALLKVLEKINPSQVEVQLSKLIKPELEIGHNRPWNDYLERAKTIPKGYETDFDAYHNNRKEVLEYLDLLLR